MELFLLGLIALCPVVIVFWLVRAIRRWSGWWRFAPVGPLTLLGAGIVVAARGVRHDPMGHSGWELWLLASMMAAGIATFILKQVHAGMTRRVEQSATGVPAA
jgi:hypothetical protein